MVKVTLIYAGHQVDYLYGLVSGFKSNPDIELEVIDSKRTVDFELGTSKNIKILKFLDAKPNSKFKEIFRWLKYYIQLTFYFFFTSSKIIHIEWINSKIDFFEHYYFVLIKKLFRKYLVFKVHDLDTKLLLKGGTDNHENLKRSNQFFLKNCDSLFVHNNFVKSILIANGIDSEKIEVIPHGINNYYKLNNIDKGQTRAKLGISSSKKVLLFYGNIRKYKGLNYLLEIVDELSQNYSDLHLIIAGKNDVKDTEYNQKMNNLIQKLKAKNTLSYFPGFVSNEATEIYFKASDVLVLPYKFIYQSGLPFLSFATGLPVLCSETGGIPEDIIKTKTGFYAPIEEFDQVIKGFLDGELVFWPPNKIIAYATNEYDWKRLTKLKIKNYERISK